MNKNDLIFSSLASFDYFNNWGFVSSNPELLNLVDNWVSSSNLLEGPNKSLSVSKSFESLGCSLDLSGLSDSLKQSVCDSSDWDVMNGFKVVNGMGSGVDKDLTFLDCCLGGDGSGYNLAEYVNESMDSSSKSKLCYNSGQHSQISKSLGFSGFSFVAYNKLFSNLDTSHINCDESSICFASECDDSDLDIFVSSGLDCDLINEFCLKDQDFIELENTLEILTPSGYSKVVKKELSLIQKLSSNLSKSLNEGISAAKNSSALSFNNNSPLHLNSLALSSSWSSYVKSLKGKKSSS